MNYKELMEKSREVMGTKLCKSCPVCDGRACRNTMPGPGAKGIGDEEDNLNYKVYSVSTFSARY